MVQDDDIGRRNAEGLERRRAHDLAERKLRSEKWAREAEARSRQEEQVEARRSAAKTKLHDWTQTSVRFVLLGNSGGTVAVLSFIGAAKPTMGVPPVAICAVASFVLGLIFAGFSTLGFWARAARSLGDAQEDAGFLGSLPLWLRNVLPEHAGRFAVLSFIGFLIGAGVGVATLWFVRFEPSVIGTP